MLNPTSTPAASSLSLEKTQPKNPPVFQCRTCNFASDERAAAENHLLLVNKGRRFDSQWWHEIPGLERTGSTKPRILKLEFLGSAILDLKDPRAEWNSIPIGSSVEVRYWDHVFYRDSETSEEKAPRLMVAAGILDYRDDQVVRLNWERYEQPTGSGTVRHRSTGLTILRNTIIELRKQG